MIGKILDKSVELEPRRLKQWRVINFMHRAAEEQVRLRTEDYERAVKESRSGGGSRGDYDYVLDHALALDRARQDLSNVNWLRQRWVDKHGGLLSSDVFAKRV